MVLPIVAAVVGVLGLGFIGFSISDFVVYWGSVATGFSLAVLSFRYLFMEDPTPLTSDETWNNALYLVFSSLVGVLGFYVVQAVMLALGFTAALIAAVLLVAGWFLGFGVVASALSSLVFFVIEVFGEVSE